jgi:hypothetical protein
MRPRALDFLGAIVLSVVLVALLVWIVLVASQGS